MDYVRKTNKRTKREEQRKKVRIKQKEETKFKNLDGFDRKVGRACRRHLKRAKNVEDGPCQSKPKQH